VHHSPSFFLQQKVNHREANNLVQALQAADNGSSMRLSQNVMQDIVSIRNPTQTQSGQPTAQSAICQADQTVYETYPRTSPRNVQMIAVTNKQDG
jgi:hypothetical protein